MKSMERLLSHIRHYPVIDNHAHNLLLPHESEKKEVISITTEAYGDALHATNTSLSHLRALTHLRTLYGCGHETDWEGILKIRKQWLQERPDELVRKCLNGIYAILMDDGIGGAKGPQSVHHFSWHDQYTQQPTKRIVRIETLAETCILDAVKQIGHIDAKNVNNEENLHTFWATFADLFEANVARAIEDPQVAGFKSVVCYRTGLDVQLTVTNPSEIPKLEAAISEILLQALTSSNSDRINGLDVACLKISSKGLNDWLVCKTLDIISAHSSQSGQQLKPIQFHTGLGDADIDLRTASPAHLKSIIEAYPAIPIVLLHASYPFTREAGYLAMAYENVYLDIGEVFPQLSHAGQVSVFRQSIELVPYSKILWSTDGHDLPETYYLANVQFREVLEKALSEQVSNNEITCDEAINLVKSILFQNSNKLYSLRLPEPPEPSLVRHNDDTGKALVTHQRWDTESWLDSNEVKYIYVRYMDFMGTLRTRILPVASFKRMMQSESRLPISLGNSGTLQDDTITVASNPVGQILLRPDTKSLYGSPTSQLPKAATIMCFWEGEDGKPISLCPRIALKEKSGSPLSLVDQLFKSYNINLLIGFEIEVVFLHLPGEGGGTDYMRPLTTNHNWGSLSFEDKEKALPLLTKIVEALAEVGIEVEQFHSESGNGQYEFVLPPKPPLASIDSLVRAREIIQDVAHGFGLRATYHPMPLSGVGNASHVHISLNKSVGPVSVATEMRFWGGVLRHIEAVCAFCLPEEVSYKRVVENCWSGGTWVAWGEQNRETPLRRVKQGRWEVRCLDGFANMYLAIRAIVAAGVLGLEEDYGDIAPPCPRNPSKMNESERAHCKLRSMPRSIETALHFLERDDAFKRKFGSELVADYVVMKKAEQHKLREMGERKSRKWLIERY